MAKEPICRQYEHSEDTARHSIFKCEALRVKKRKIFVTLEIKSLEYLNLLTLMLELIRDSSLVYRVRASEQDNNFTLLACSYLKRFRYLGQCSNLLLHF